MMERIPTLTDDGYPTVATLREIREWEIEGNADIRALLDYCREAWWHQESFGVPRHVKIVDRETWISASTGGWSGNEAIIEALQGNTMFWNICWLRSDRGGHFRFLARPLAEDKNV